MGLLDTWKEVSFSCPVGTTLKKEAFCMTGSTKQRLKLWQRVERN